MVDQEKKKKERKGYLNNKHIHMNSYICMHVNLIAIDVHQVPSKRERVRREKEKKNTLNMN